MIFKALQTYSDGEISRWIDEPVEGGEEPEHPAPVLKLAKAADAAAPAADGLRRRRSPPSPTPTRRLVVRCGGRAGHRRSGRRCARAGARRAGVHAYAPVVSASSFPATRRSRALVPGPAGFSLSAWHAICVVCSDRHVGYSLSGNAIKGETLMRVVRTVAGLVLLTIGLPVLLVGGALWTLMQHRDAGGAFSGSLEPVSTSGRAIVVPDVDTLLARRRRRSSAPATPRLRLTVRDGETAWAWRPPADGARLPGRRGVLPRRRGHRRPRRPAGAGHAGRRRGLAGRPLEVAPGTQSFWTRQGSGTLEWTANEVDGREMSLVVMRVDATRRPGGRPAGLCQARLAGADGLGPARSAPDGAARASPRWPGRSGRARWSSWSTRARCRPCPRSSV